MLVAVAKAVIEYSNHFHQAKENPFQILNVLPTGEWQLDSSFKIYLRVI